MPTPSVTAAGKGIETANSTNVVDTGSFAVTGTSLGVFAVCLAGAGTPALPTSVKFDPTGQNLTLPLIQSVSAFNTFWIAAIYGAIGPTAATAVVRATWAAAPDEGLVIGIGVKDMDQSAGWRTPLNTPGSGSGSTNPIVGSLAVTTLHSDLVLGFGCNTDQAAGLTTLTSSTLTIPTNGKLEGANGTGNEQLAIGWVAATGVSTTASFSYSTAASSVTWKQFGLSLIPTPSDLKIFSARQTTRRPRPFGPGFAR